MITDPQPKTREEWFSLVDEQAASGLSQKEFCSQRNLILCRFSYYKTQRVSNNPKPHSHQSNFIKQHRYQVLSKLICLMGFVVTCQIPYRQKI
jgi:hypothetical protein